MNVQKKIYGAVFLWVILSAFCFFYLFPKFSNGLLTLQQNHQTQIDEDNRLNAQIKALNQMQAELDQISKEPLQPKDLFTQDIQLVKEVQHIEQIAQLSNATLTLSLSGTADKATPYPSTSALFSVPYIIHLEGNFPGIVQFFKYLQNSYFVSPINGFDITESQGKVSASITTNFFIHQRQ